MLFGVMLVGSFGCASAERAPCPAQAWAGDCVLRSVTKVEERELPVPYVIYEGVYAPQRNSQYPQFTPADVRVRMGALAKHGLALSDYYKANPVVHCHAAPVAGSCVPQDAVADLKEFDPAQANASSAPRTTGCAAIDASSEQDRLARSGASSSQIPERFQFTADSAALAPEANESAKAVAQRLLDNPSIECVGVVGQISQGESASLAEGRARAIKQLLVSLGVDSKRLTTIAVNSNVYGQGAKTPEADPNNRRVSLSVLLETALKPQP
jgi:outer membrane protein OmpA-like peptidoglycan-associated protein